MFQILSGLVFRSVEKLLDLTFNKLPNIRFENEENIKLNSARAAGRVI